MVKPEEGASLARALGAASVVVMSGRTDGFAIASAVGADGYVRKPLEANDLLRTLCGSNFQRSFPVAASSANTI